MSPPRRRVLMALASAGVALAGLSPTTHAQGPEAPSEAPEAAPLPAPDVPAEPAPEEQAGVPDPDAPTAPSDDETSEEDREQVVRAGAADESLEELLGLDLEETLGSTTAASRSRESVLSAPATLTTLDARAIRLSGARTLPDLLRVVPGIQVAESAPGSFIVSLRGMNGVVGNNVVVTLEGVPLNDPLDGSIEWAAIPLDPRDLERIEVVRGPVSAVYGANAYSGVVNLVPYRGYGQLPVWGMRAEGTVDGRGAGAGNLAMRWTRRDAHHEYALLGLGGYDGVFSGTRVGSNPALGRVGMLGRLGLDVGRGRFEAQLGFTAFERSSLEHLSLARRAEWRSVTTARVAFTSGELPGFLDRISVWGRALDHRVPSDDEAPTQGFSYGGTNALRTNVGFDLSSTPHRTLRLTLGGQLDLDAVRAPYVYGGNDGLTRFGYGSYLQAAYEPHENVSLAAAVRLDVPTVDPTPLLSYRGAAVYHTSSLALRVAASSSFRAPTYVERLGRFVDPSQGIIILEGSPLAAPRNTTFEVGATYAPTTGVRLGASVYASRLTHLVLEDFFTIPRKTFESDPEQRWLGGVELELHVEVADALHLDATTSLLHYFSDEGGFPPTVAVQSQNSLYSAALRLRGAARGDRLHYGLGGSFASRRSFSGAVGVPWVYQRTNYQPVPLLDAMVEHVLPTDLPFWVYLRAQVNPLGRTQQSFLPGSSPVGTAITVGIEVRRD